MWSVTVAKGLPPLSDLKMIEALKDLPQLGELRKIALPPGYPFLVDDQGAVCEPALLYLASNFSPKRRWKATTVSNKAYDLLDWFRFLESQTKDWNCVDRVDLTDWCDGMSSAICPRTGEPYEMRTVRRRLGTVRDLYRWAAEEGFFQGSMAGARVTTRAARPIDANPMAHVGTASTAERGMLTRENRSDGDTVSPLSNDDWKLIAPRLGPLPTARTLNDLTTTSRDRIGAELSLSTGMRVFEVAALTARQILNLRVDPENEFGMVVLRLTRTKGSRPRDVRIPMHVLIELHKYIDSEREECIAQARKRGLLKNRRAPEALFVNTLAAKHHVGKAVHPQTLSAAFRSAVRAAGLTSSVQKTNAETGKPYFVDEVDHSYHDLRHTFAVWLYLFEREKGNAEPWKVVQAALGHKNLATTINTYLRYVEHEKLSVNTALYQHLKHLVGDYGKA